MTGVEVCIAMGVFLFLVWVGRNDPIITFQLSAAMVAAIYAAKEI